MDRVDYHNQVMKLCAAHKHVRTLRYTVKKCIFLMDMLITNVWICYKMTEANAEVSKSDFVHNYCKKATDGMNFYLKRGSTASFDAMHDGVTNQIIQSTPSGAPNTKCESNCTVSQDNYAVL